MSNLTEALERFEVASNEPIEGQEGTWVAPASLDDMLLIFEAASAHAALTSPETIEKAAKALFNFIMQDMPVEPFGTYQSDERFREQARTVFRAVKEDT